MMMMRMGHGGGILAVLGLVVVCCALGTSPSQGQGNNGDGDGDCQDYGEALGKAILFFEGQRSGKLPSTQRVELSGGYYDAGDNVKFGWPMAFSVSLLSWAGVEYRGELLDQNTTNSSISLLTYLLQAIRWGTDFLLHAHSSSTTLYTQVGDGKSDHGCWERPEDMDTPRTLYKINSTSPGSQAAAEAAAALSAASMLLPTTLHPIKVDKYRGSYQASCPFYCSFSGYQEFFSGKELGKYKSDADSFVCALMPGSGTVQIRTTPGGLLYTRDGNNLQYVTASSMVLFIYSNTLTAAQIGGVQCGSAHFPSSQIRAFAKSQVDYILGSNPKKMSYMLGYGRKYPKQIHHRGASIPSIHALPERLGCNEGYSSWYSSNKPDPNTHVGAVVGGPNSDDQFSDVRSDYSHSEPTTYTNAAFVGSLAGLIHKTSHGEQLLHQVGR